MSLIEMPSFQTEREAAQWLKGKATREELKEVEKDLRSVQLVLNSQAQLINKVFHLTRINGLQLETLVRMFDIPNFFQLRSSFRDEFDAELNKTFLMVSFLDNFSDKGQYAGKPMKERIDIIRNWNKQPETLKIEGFHFGLPEYINEHRDEFTESELMGLEFEFKFKYKKPEEVTATPLNPTEPKAEENDHPNQP